MQDTVFKELTTEIASSIANEDMLFMIFKFIQKHVPCDRLICFSSERKTKILNIHIEVAEGVFSSDRYSAEASYLLADDIVFRSINEYDENFLITNDVSKTSLHSPFSGTRYYYNASIAVTLHTDRAKGRVLTLFLTSADKNVFKEEHRKLLGVLFPLLQELTRPYFEKQYDPQLILDAGGRLPSSSEELLRRCPSFETLFRQISTIAQTACTVLISGPTGSGKELIADTIHSLSPRSKSPFIKVNCGAIPETLLESEFFGFERGAFTGAVSSKAGYFEQANRGTLLLDEVGELSPAAQSKLLRVLETHIVQRIGSSRIIKLDVRVIAATHRDLRQMVEKGLFREDLFYRLFAFPVTVPPLRERIADIPLLTEYFYRYYVQLHKIVKPPVLHQYTVRQLAEYPWPGNVRQLRYAIEQALLLAVANGWPELRFDAVIGLDAPAEAKKHRAKMTGSLADEIMQALEKTGGRIQGPNGAAELLKLHPATLRSRMRSLGIPLPRENRSGNK